MWYEDGIHGGFIQGEEMIVVGRCQWMITDEGISFTVPMKNEREDTRYECMIQFPLILVLVSCGSVVDIYKEKHVIVIFCYGS